MQNKHIIRFSFIGVFFIVIANIILYRQFIIKTLILPEIAFRNQILMESYQQNVSDWIKKVAKKHRSEIGGLKFEDYKAEFIKKNHLFFHNQAFINVRILNKDSVEIFRIGHLPIADNIRTSVAYNHIGSIFDKWIVGGLISDGKLLLRVPIDSNTRFEGIGSFAIEEFVIKLSDDKYFKVILYRDITHLWQSISALESGIFLVFLMFFGALFAVVIYNTRYAQSIIDRQFELNKTLSQAKRKAEIDGTYKMQFLANVSHELRTPLNSIIGFSEIILADKGRSISNEKNMEYVNDIYTSGKHLLEMINDILDYSKAKAQKLRVDIIDVDLNKLGRSCLRFFELKAEQAKIQLTLEAKEHIVIKADPKRLKQAILNLVSNAIKFTPEDGKIILEITKSLKSKRVYIRVIDTGIGIAPEDLPKALSSFEQVDDKKDRRFEGTGLGLPLTKTLVEIMNGKFSIESKVGEGTIVTLSFDSANNIDYSK